MKKKNLLIWIIIIISLIFIFSLIQKPKTSIKKQDIINKNQQSVNFKNITSNQLSLMLSNKDFKLIDVHIPEQVHIPKTDYVIPYNKIEDIISSIPNKDTKIVLYCRSGSMSKVASEALVKKGYTNIYNLTNGMNEWKSENRNTVPIESIINKN